MFTEKRNAPNRAYNPMLDASRKKRMSAATVVAIVLMASLFVAGAVFLSWGDQWRVPGKLIERLPFPGRLTQIEWLVNGAAQSVAAGAALVVNPRDTLQIRAVHTDGWWSKGVKLKCADFDPEAMRREPVPIGRFIPAESLAEAKETAIIAGYLGTEVGRVLLRVELDGRDWKERAALSRRPEEKIGYLRKALAADPGNTLIKMQLATLLTEEKQYAQAADLYRQVLAQGKTVEVMEKLLDLHKRAGEVDAALDVYLDLIASEADPALFSDFLAYLGKHKAVGDKVRFLHQHAKDIPGPLRGAYYLFLAQACTEAKSWNEATEAYQKALKAGARDPNIYYNMAVASEKSANADGAVSALQQYLKANPKDLDTWMKLAAMLQKSGDKAAERQVYEKVLALNPQHEQALVRLVALLEKADDKKALIQAYEKLLKLKPNDAVVQYNLAVRWYETQNWEEATKGFEKLHEKDPKDVHINRYLLDLYTRAGNDAGRIKLLNQWIAADPDQASCYDALIELYKKKEDYQGMATAAAKASTKFPKSTAYLQYLLFAKLKLGDEKGALETLEALIRLEPKQKKYLQQAAGLYEKQKNYDAAMKKVQQILELDPKDKQANDDYLRLAGKKLGLKP